MNNTFTLKGNENKFHKEFGYEFISAVEGNINRIMDPYFI